MDNTNTNMSVSIDPTSTMPASEDLDANPSMSSSDPVNSTKVHYMQKLIGPRFQHYQLNRSQ